MRNYPWQLYAVFVLALVASSCQPSSSTEAGSTPEETAGEAEDPRYDFTIEPGKRVGLVTLESASKSAVLEAYGDLAKADSVHLSEGFFGPGVILFPENERNRVDIYWETSVDAERPAFIRILGANGATDWATNQGITIGSTLDTVEAINGRPFELYGFEWDYGGYVNDWEGGQLSNNLSLRFAPSAGVDTPMEVVGDMTLSSDNELLRQARPVVSELSLSFPSTNLLPLMQGDWQSVSDPGYQIRIEDGKIWHYTNDRLMYTARLEADQGCQTSPCIVNDQQPEGFCFLEKGEQDVQCNLVLSCDGERLEYAAIGTAGGTLAFERME
ncbi:MAG: hypothetical protein GVY26_12020 [Bacteroidetes bacterium]|jgi:hypothetical protein|nr:hypothetical protein [Bacteroidota bacterium]